MMNSSADMFTDNPFRSNGGGGGGGGGGNDDFFYDETPPQQQQPLYAQPMNFQHGEPTMSFQAQQQQQLQQQPMMMDPSMSYSPQPVKSNFPPPSGAMRPLGGPSPSMSHVRTGGQPTNQSWWQSFLFFWSFDSYKAYFDVDAEDIVIRVKAVIFDFHKPEHFRNNVLGIEKTDTLKGPDLYGPFWLTMTLIFFIGVSSLS